MNPSGITHHRDCDGLVDDEVIVEGQQIRPPAAGEEQGGLDLEAEGVGTLDGAERGLELLIQRPADGLQVLDDVLGSRVRGRGGDVVQRGLFREQLRLWPGQETLVDRLKGHRDGQRRDAARA